MLVGGAVRDACLGRLAADLDWLVIDPERAARDLADTLGGSLVALDPERGHWRVVLTGGDAQASGTARSWDFASPRPAERASPRSTERASPRSDERASPRSGEGAARTPLDPLDPAVLDADLRARDLSVNAMAWWPGSHELVDPTGGLADLQAGVARAVSLTNLRADPLRAYRILRFAAQLGFRVDPATEGWLRTLATEFGDGVLPLPAAERLGAELEAITATPAAARAWAALVDLGLLERVLPELLACRGVQQGGLHHADVLDHQLEALGCLLRLFPDADLALRWATLLHDVGKPGTMTPATEANGLRLRPRFEGHDQLGADLAARLLRRLRRPAEVVERVAGLIRAHMRPLPNGERATRRFVHRLRAWLPDLLRLMLADREAARGPQATAQGRLRYREAVGRVLAVLDEQPTAPPPLVDGRRLMEALGIEQGPLVGQLLAAVAEAQALGEVSDSDAALAYAGRMLAAQRGKR